MIETPTWMWAAFFGFIILMLWLDLGVFNKKVHRISIRESLGWTFFWAFLAFAFGVGIYLYGGANHAAEEKALEFFAGYLIEESLSIDNLFVILLIFNYFKVNPEHQHKVLFWGIIGALIMRFAMILLGVTLIQQFSWINYIFGAFLVFTGSRMAFGVEKELHPENNPIILLFRKMFPVHESYSDHKFFIRIDGRLLATPLFIVVLAVEVTDLIFAVDSIPAILAITHDPFIVYTSNAFAILGLRSLFFALAGIMDLFHYLRYGLAAVLVFIGVKMSISGWYHISTGFALLMVATILSASIIVSLLRPVNKSKQLDGKVD